MQGNFDEEEVTPEQLHGAAIAFAWAASTFSISSPKVAGHLVYAATACPGRDLYSYVRSGELTRRVGDLLATGPVDLPIVCGPEAVERVAAIDAG